MGIKEPPPHNLKEWKMRKKSLVGWMWKKGMKQFTWGLPDRDGVSLEYPVITKHNWLHMENDTVKVRITIEELGG